MKNKKEIDGYYYDGKKLWILYKDKYGNITEEECKDEQSD